MPRKPTKLNVAMRSRIKKRRSSKLLEALSEGHDLVDKSKFLVRRAEFLYQQGLTFHAQSQDLMRDIDAAGARAEALSTKIDAIRQRRPRRKK